MHSFVLIAYIAVVIVWSTTPIGIVWSAESVHPTMAVFLRMAIAAVLGLLLIYWKKITFPWNKTSIRLYASSALGIYGGLTLTYAAAESVPSGVISLFFGLAPIFSGMLASKILGEARFTNIRKVSLAVAITGLAIVCSDRLGVSYDSWPGLVMVLIAVFFFSYSAVLVKSIKIKINPLATTVGALMLSLPLFALSWWFMDGTLPIDQWQPRALWSIAYLGVFGSLLGFVAYYYILQKLLASTVALITLMTPVIALAIGAVFNNEVISAKMAAGALLVMVGLFLYLLGDKFLKKYLPVK